jgi:hypothetical protein
MVSKRIAPTIELLIKQQSIITILPTFPQRFSRRYHWLCWSAANHSLTHYILPFTETLLLYLFISVFIDIYLLIVCNVALPQSNCRGSTKIDPSTIRPLLLLLHYHFVIVNPAHPLNPKHQTQVYHQWSYITRSWRMPTPILMYSDRSTLFWNKFVYTRMYNNMTYVISPSHSCSCIPSLLSMLPCLLGKA